MDWKIELHFLHLNDGIENAFLNIDKYNQLNIPTRALLKSLPLIL